MDEIRPTSDDLARDLRADLAVVEAATPGPWADDVPAGHVYNPDWLRLGWDRGIVATTDDDTDTRAIAAMRDGWPAAIRRALAAEAEAARLNDTLALLSALMAAKQEELERLQAALNSLVLAAGSTIVTDGDTTCSLGWWATQVLEGGAR